MLPVYEPFSMVTGRITMKMQQNPNQSGTQERTGPPNSFIVLICAKLLFQPSYPLLIVPISILVSRYVLK